MPSIQTRHIGYGLAAAAVIGCAFAVAGGPAAAQSPTTLVPQLPDLVQATPRRLGVVEQRSNGKKRYRLIFASAAENRGFGANGGGQLVLVGHRPDTETRTMVVDQYVDMFDPQTGQIPTQAVFPDVARMRFVRNEDHRHWHSLQFERYELRRASDYRPVSRDRKTGFCVGNRYRVRGAHAAQRLTDPDFDSHCALNQPDRLSVTVGLSVGWGDDYKPLIEGQFVDVTKVRSGRYVLVHRVNVDKAMQESDYDNNAASVLVKIRRRHEKKPTVSILRSCPGQERCPPPGGSG
jgi:hypothetical protein